MTPHVVFIWKNVGEYHSARMNALSARSEFAVNVIELYETDKTHPWAVSTKPAFARVTLRARQRNEFFDRIIGWKMYFTLMRMKPEIVVIPGYAALILLKAACFARLFGAKAILFSETHEQDKPRSALREFFKKILLRLYHSILVPGERSRNYLEKLEYPKERIFEVGNTVGNDYFSERADEIRRNSKTYRVKFNLPEKYFLFVGRFAKEKNLFRLLDAYKQYVNTANGKWGLVLVGTGDEEVLLKNRVASENLKTVKFYGFQNQETLSIFYALASAFVLPSLSEPWGLVTNEAAASSLPLIVSNRCGCVPELVRRGENGFTFDPLDAGELTRLMKGFSDDKWDLKKFGEKSSALVQKLSLEIYAEKVSRAFKTILAKDFK